jgi:hypothetical protein
MAVLLETKNQEDGHGGAGGRSTHGRSISNGSGTTGPMTSSKRASRATILGASTELLAEVNEERSSPDRDVDETMTTLYEADDMVPRRWPT